MTLPSLTLPCHAHREVRLLGVHHIAESDSPVCITPQSQAATVGLIRGVKVPDVHHTKKSWGQNFPKNPRCASHCGVKLRSVHPTGESKSNLAGLWLLLKGQSGEILLWMYTSSIKEKI